MNEVSDENELVTLLRRHRVMAIVRGNSREASAATARILLEEGVRLVEVTLNTPGALDTIADLAATRPEDTLVGAGTVLTRGDVADVLAAGGEFAVTPCPAESVQAAVAAGLPVAAGAYTAGEAYAMWQAGASLVKLFPAGPGGGPAYLRALRDPLQQVRFMAVGGVGADELPAYLAAGALGAGVGGPLVGDAPSGGDLDQLRSRTRTFLQSVESCPR